MGSVTNVTDITLNGWVGTPFSDKGNSELHHQRMVSFPGAFLEFSKKFYKNVEALAPCREYRVHIRRGLPVQGTLEAHFSEGPHAVPRVSWARMGCPVGHCAHCSRDISLTSLARKGMQ